MQFSVTFRHMDATDALKQYAREKLERIQKYFGDPMSVDVTMTADKRRHRVDVGVKLRNGLTLSGHETTENMYSSIDLVLAKLERQIRRYKEKLISKRQRAQPLSALQVRHTVYSDDGSPDEAVEPPTTIKREHLDAQPLTVDEAIMQMNLNHQAFLVFRNQDTGDVNVVYRRDDTTYGLIEASNE